MKNETIRKHNIGNKGMSLVEVIIAVALLTIVIIPVMRSFVYSARVNAKARTLQKATVAAQTIMENYKAYSVEDICQQFASGTFMVGSGTGVSYCETVHDLTSGQHIYMINDILYENSTYDAQIVLTPSTPIQVNSYQDSDPYCDAVYMVEAGHAYDVYNTVVNEAQARWSALPDKADTVPDDYNLENLSFNRQVEIYVDSNGKTTVKEVYWYDASCDYATETGSERFWFWGYAMPDAAHPDAPFIMKYNKWPGDEEPPPIVIYDNSSTKAASDGRAVLKNVYLYFYPLYTTSNSDTWIDSDNVQVYSSYTPADGGKLNFYAIKQKSPMSATELEVRESAAYNSERIHFKLNGQLKMYDNLNVNVGRVDGGSVSITSPTLEPGAERVGSLHADPKDKILIYGIEVVLYGEKRWSIDNEGNLSEDSGEQPIFTLTGTIND